MAWRSGCQEMPRRHLGRMRRAKFSALDALLLYPQPNALTPCQCTVQSRISEIRLTQDEPQDRPNLNLERGEA